MSLPSAARAIGLGDIRVDSALNEPLSAQIDIVGATRDELAALTAKIASREVFQRYGADRPSFLSSATFKVGLDSQGRPVLNIRSSEAFTDPLVSFLVDLRWGGGDLVREYSLLLDPAGFGPAARTPEPAYAVMPSTPSSAAPSAAPAASVQDVAAPVAPEAPAPVAPTASPTATVAAAGNARAPHRIASHDTLRAIARRSGARTELAIQRTMIALFRANPHAFDGNINRLHLGAVLTMPADDDISAIPAADARREVRAQMTAWRLDGRQSAVHRVAAQPAAVAAPAAPAATAPASAAPASAAPVATAPVATAPASAPPAAIAQAPDDAAIKNRLQTLEQELDEVHKQLATDHAKIQDLRHASDRAAAAGAEPHELPPSSSVQAAEATQAEPAGSASPGWLGGKSLIGALATGMGLMVAGFVYLRRRKTVIEPHPYDVIAAEEHLAKLARADDDADGVSAPAASPPRAVEAARPEAGRRSAIVVEEAPAPAPAPTSAAATETTVDLAVDTEALERSYLDSMDVDSLGIDTSVLDSGAHPMAEHDLSDVRAAGANDTVVVDPSLLDTAEHEVTGMETIAMDASDLDAEIANEALNTAVLDVKAFNAAAAAAAGQTELDYNLLDLDATGQHVEMPSKLHDRVEVSERRTNIIDVLKAAIERDPYRRDLRMKLLETYYAAATLNQRAFLEIVRTAAHERDFLSTEDWEKVRTMGRDIAAADPMFQASSTATDLADCA